MLGQSWLSEALGSDAQHPDPTAPGETATITSVVRGFLRNDAKFSRADVERYINDGLQNEAVDIWNERAVDEEVVDAWRERFDAAVSALDEPAAEHASAARDAMAKQAAESYDTGRASFAEAVLLARSSNRVLLTPDTCSWVTRFDHDGAMSEAMGLDVKEVFGANPAYASAPAGPGVSLASQAQAQRVDFAREGVPSGAADERGRSLQVDPKGPLAGARRAPEPVDTAPLAKARERQQRRSSGDPVRVKDAVAEVVASLKQYHPGHTATDTASTSVEPEMG